MTTIRITETKKDGGFYEAGVYIGAKLCAVVSRQMVGGKFCVYSDGPVKRFRVKREALNAAVSIAVGSAPANDLAAA